MADTTGERAVAATGISESRKSGVGPLVPQPHGGALRVGGPGRPKLQGDALRRAAALRSVRAILSLIPQAYERAQKDDARAQGWADWLIRVFLATGMGKAGRRGTIIAARGGQVQIAEVHLPPRTAGADVPGEGELSPVPGEGELSP